MCTAWKKSETKVSLLKLISAFFEALSCYTQPPKRVLAPVIFGFKTQITVGQKHVSFMCQRVQCSSLQFHCTYCHCDTSTMILTVSNIRMLMSFPSLSQNGKKTHTQRKSRGYHNNFMWRKNVNCIGHAVFFEMQEWVQWNFC